MARHLPLPQQAYLQSLLTYEPETGALIWRLGGTGTRDRGGTAAGTLTTRGHYAVMIGGKTYQASRIIWMLMHGVDPGALEVDHIDRDKANLRLDNLRLATPGQEMANRQVRADNTTGFKGVTLRKRSGLFEARIGIAGKRLHIGTFSSAEEAAEAYAAKAAELYGDFATTTPYTSS